MAVADRCPNCGHERAASAPKGSCPVCLARSTPAGSTPESIADVTELIPGNSAVRVVVEATLYAAEAGTGSATEPGEATGVWPPAAAGPTKPGDDPQAGA
jgi:hypothetical protein